MADIRSPQPETSHRKRRRRGLLWGVIGLLTLAALIGLGIGGETWLHEQHLSSAAQVRAALNRWGTWASLLSIGLVAVHAFVPYPAEIMALANGAIFGFARGLLLTWTGSMVGAVLSYGLARLAGSFVREHVLNERSRGQLSLWHARHGVRTLLAVRLLPLISFSAVNYLAGLSGVPFWQFLWTTAIGILPVGILVVGAGAGWLATEGLSLWIGISAILAVVPFVPLFWHYVRGRYTRPRQ